MDVTICIPTFNRWMTLEKAIRAYFAQTEHKAIRELLVIDDGSRDSTPQIVDQLSREAPIHLRYFRQANRGPAAARNVGIREAKSDLILFTDDDIIPSRGLVSQHLEWHNRFRDESFAVLGHVEWSPEVSPTPFMRWYGSAALFEFDRLRGRTEVEERYFYTCNVSVKTQLLRQSGGFDEDFKVAAYEDIELGRRLGKLGMRLFYNKDAVAYHLQHFTFEDVCRRATKVEPAARVFRTKEVWVQDNHGAPNWLVSSLKARCKLVLIPALRPFKKLVDTRFPLPKTFYKVMFRVHR